MNKTFRAPAVIRSRPKNFPEKGILVGGFSASGELLYGLATALEKNYVLQDVWPVTLADALKYPDALQEASEDRTVVAHSLGPIVVRQAGALIALNGAEPTSSLRSAVGAFKVSTNSKKIGREEGLPYIGFINGAIETAKNPRTILTTFRLGNFSTLQMMIDGGEEAFPGGRIYSPSTLDEYGFGHHNNEEERAREKDIFWAMREGHHDRALLHPNETAAQLAQFIEEAKQ